MDAAYSLPPRLGATEHYRRTGLKRLVCCTPRIYDLSDTITKSTFDVYNVPWICSRSGSGLFDSGSFNHEWLNSSLDGESCDVAAGRKDASTSGVCTVHVAWSQRTTTLPIGMAAACMYLYLYGRTTSGQALLK